MTAPKEQLLLSLAHESLTPELLSALIERTREECEIMLPFHTCPSDHVWGESKEPHDPRIEENKTDRPVQHLMLAGSSYVMKPGKELEDWESAWTPGEQILGSVIDKIGLNKFHRRSTGYDVKRTARLIDVNPNQYDNILAEKALCKKLESIATQTSNNLKLDNSSGIQKAVILLPFDERMQTIEVENIRQLALDIFQDCWHKQDGPLNNAEIEVKLVSAD